MSFSLICVLLAYSAPPSHSYHTAPSATDKWVTPTCARSPRAWPRLVLSRPGLIMDPGSDKSPKGPSRRGTTSNMPPSYHHLTPTKPTCLGGDGEPSSLAKFNPNSPSESGYLPQTPIRPSTSNGDAKGIAERRRARQSMTPTKPLAKFDSLCEDSKTILSDMAGMFSPGKVETKTPEAPPFKVKVEMAVPPVKKPSKKDRRDGRMKHGQPRRKKVVNPRLVRRSAHPPAKPTLEEGNSKPAQ